MANGAPEWQQQESNRPVKRRSACDECRTKKLKCTGELPRCSRCAREGIICVYSPQKQMGRPKKRRADEVEEPPNSNGDGMNADGTEKQRWDSARQTQMDFEMTNYESAFTPGGSLQPWLHTGDWEFSGSDDNAISGAAFTLPTDSAMPGLTPDNSSKSSPPPLLNLPPELRNTTSTTQHRSYSDLGNNDLSTTLLLDPTLASNGDGSNLGMPPSLVPSCACLSTMYLMLTNLQTMDPTFAFPFALHPLREAMQVAADVIACEDCPQRFISAVQNVQLIGTLLVCIADRFSRILASISAEAARAHSASETKKFRLADLNTSTSHLHTGGIGCAAAFSINLDPDEWLRMAKKVVRAEVYGPSDGNDCCAYFLGLVERMEQRQHSWHERPMPADFPRHAQTGEVIMGRNMPTEDHMCLKYVEYARKLADGFDWA